MKLTEIVTALEIQRETVQDAIDAIKALMTLSVISAPAMVLPPPSRCAAATVRRNRTTETRAEKSEGRQIEISRRRENVREASGIRTGQAGSLQAVRSRLRAGMGPEKESRKIQFSHFRAEAC